jgi:hypothetical protein
MPAIVAIRIMVRDDARAQSGVQFEITVKNSLHRTSRNSQLNELPSFLISPGCAAWLPELLLRFLESAQSTRGIVFLPSQCLSVQTCGTLKISVPRRYPKSLKHGPKFCLCVAVTLFVSANKTTTLAPCLIVNRAWSAIALH